MSVAALMGFIFAVLSPFLFCLCFLNFPASVIAIVLGHLAIVQIGRSQGMLHGKGLAITSLVIGYPILLASLAFLSWIFVIAPATRPTAAPGFPSGLPMARNMFGDGQTGQGNGLEIELDEQPGKSNASTPPIPSSVPNSPGGAPGGTNIPGNPSGPLGGPLGGPQVPKMPESPQSPDVNSSASGMPRMPGTPGMPGMPSFPSRPQFPRPNFNLPPGVPDPFGNAGVPGSSPPGMPTPPNFPGFPGFPGTPGGPGFPTPNGGQSPPGGGDSTPNSTPRTTPKATPKSTPKTTPETTPDTTAGGVTGGPPSFNPFAPVPVDPDTVLASFPDMGWPVRSLSFSADGGRLAVGRIDAGFTVFDIESGKAVFQRDRLASLGAVVSLAWSPDGKYLFAGGQSGQLVSWEVEQPTAKPRNHKGHARNVACLVVGPEARFIISAGDDRSVTWQQPDAPDKARSLTLPGSGDILALRIGSPPITAMATDGKAIYEINLKTSAITNTVELERRPCQSADFSTDGSRLAVSEGREVKVYDTATGKPTLTIQVGSEMLWCVRYTPDNQQLVTGGRGMFYVFAPDSGKRLAGISVGQPLYVKTMAFDRESRQAAVIPDSAGQTLRVFRLPTTAPKSSP
jgi:hypothetical protein